MRTAATLAFDVMIFFKPGGLTIAVNRQRN